MLNWIWRHRCNFCTAELRRVGILYEWIRMLRNPSFSHHLTTGSSEFPLKLSKLLATPHVPPFLPRLFALLPVAVLLDWERLAALSSHRDHSERTIIIPIPKQAHSSPLYKLSLPIQPSMSSSGRLPRLASCFYHSAARFWASSIPLCSSAQHPHLCHGTKAIALRVIGRSTWAEALRTGSDILLDTWHMLAIFHVERLKKERKR